MTRAYSRFVLSLCHLSSTKNLSDVSISTSHLSFIEIKQLRFSYCSKWYKIELADLISRGNSNFEFEFHPIYSPNFPLFFNPNLPLYKPPFTFSEWIRKNRLKKYRMGVMNTVIRLRFSTLKLPFEIPILLC